MKTYKKYDNRKYYDSEKAGYVNVTEILNSYMNGGAKVVEHSTGNDITAQTLARALAEAFQPQVLVDILSKHLHVVNNQNQQSQQ